MAIIESKEIIRNRMLKTIAQEWGYKETEMDINAFDPLIKLLVGALSKEFEKVSQEINNSSNRILKRLVELLTPDVLTRAKPSHAVIHARSVEAQSTLKPENQFYLSWEFQEETRDVYFSPVKPIPLFNAAVKYFACDSKIFQSLEVIHKEQILESTTGAKLDKSCLWLGLEFDTTIKSIHNLSFYFDWHLDADKQQYLNLIPLSRWTIENIELETSSGVPTVDQNGSKYALKKSFDISQQIENEVEWEYEKHFINLKGFKAGENGIGNIKKLLCEYPREFLQVFTVQELQDFSEELLWVKIEFPSIVPKKVLENIQCAVNCFPVINKRLHKKYYSLKPNINILPLINDAYFYAFHKLYNTEDLNYRYSESLDSDDFKAGLFHIRSGQGVAKFDERSAAELMTHLVDLLRDESSAFSGTSLDFNSADIKELEHVIARVSKKIALIKEHHEPIPYLIAKPRKPNDTVWAEYWSTNGSFANNIHIGNALSMDKEVFVDRSSIIFVTPTKGGRNRLKPEESVQQYKKALTSRGKIVTQEDIKSFCFARIGSKLADVDIRKGVEIDNTPGRGLIRVVEIRLHPTESEKGKKQEWEIFCSDIQKNMEHLTTGFFPIRVKVAP